MKYFWLRDRKHQKQFTFKWDYGDQNDRVYFTKHHPTHYHMTMCPQYIQDILNTSYQKMAHIVTTYTQEIKSSYSLARVC